MELFRRCGIGRLITTTPEFDGQSFGTNVMEGVLITLLKERGQEPTEAAYLALLEELRWMPTIRAL